MDILRVYNPDECNKDGIPLDWNCCRKCAGHGNYQPDPAWVNADGDEPPVDCDICGGYGSLKAAALAVKMNPVLWASYTDKVRIRCQDCDHPMSDVCTLGRPHDLCPEKLAVLCTRCYIDRTK